MRTLAVRGLALAFSALMLGAGCEVSRPFGPSRQGFVHMPDDPRDGPWRYTCNDGKVFIRQVETHRICEENGGIAERELVYHPVR